MTVPALRVTVDGDNNRIYHAGDKITGQVWLSIEEQEQIESFKLVFAGSCITKTTRPSHVHDVNTTPSRQVYEEKIRLFNREKELVPRCRLEPKKYSWPFEFVFPASTEPQYKRAVHGDNYLCEPHPLPPSFQVRSDVPDGSAHIYYFVQARLNLAGSTEPKRCKHMLRYSPKPPHGTRLRTRCISSVLYGQSWKPVRDKDESRVKKVLSGVSMYSTPRIVPTICHPIAVAPGQHIPLSLSLLNSRDPANHAERQCEIDTLSVTISTYSTTMCGNLTSYPEDTVSKHITCIARTNLQKPIGFGKTVPLTANTFRLIDDAECIPTFKTYTVTRRYTLGVSIGMKYQDQHFVIRSTSPLEILPRTPRDLSSLAPPDDDEEVEPLPQYSPRECEGEFAPDYEEIHNTLSRMPSSDHSMLSRVESSGSSFFSSGSIASTAASTPGHELEQFSYAT